MVIKEQGIAVLCLSCFGGRIATLCEPFVGSGMGPLVDVA